MYAAISLRLNAMAMLGPSSCRLLPYVFKVGTTLSCIGLRRDLGRSVTLNMPTRSANGHRDAGYAGFDDWHMVGCWPVPDGLARTNTEWYDEHVFSPWIRGRDQRGRHRKAVEGVRSDHIVLAGLTPAGNPRTTKDLYVMEEAFLRSGRTGLRADDLHDEILALVRQVVLDVAQPMVRCLGKLITV